MSPRVMRDSTTAADIPLPGLQLVAGYGTGHYTWSPADWARFGDMPKVVIDALGTEPAKCSVLDVESGDATPGAAPGWVIERKKALPRAYCTIYVNRANRNLVFEAMSAKGLRVGLDYQWWIATLDGTKVLPDMAGVVAVQWKAATAASGPGHFDESIVYDDAWHAAPIHNVIVPTQQLRAAVISAQQISTAAGNLAKLLQQYQ